MKKTLFTLSAITLALTLTGCDNSDQTTKNQTPTTPSVTDTVKKDVTDGIAQVKTTVEDTTEKTIPAAKDNLTWQGTYTGKLPCTDCDGIATTLTLNSDETYTLEEIYLGKKDGQMNSKGTFTWDKTGTIVTLTNDKGDLPTEYSVSENSLTKLNNNGKPLKGDVAALYHLEKETQTK